MKKNIKQIFGIFIFLLNINVYSQKVSLTIDCKEIVFDSLKYENKIVLYKILSKRVLYTKGTTSYFTTDILLPEFDKNSDRSLLQIIINKISENNQTDEFNAFKNCESKETFYQKTKLSRKQKQILKQNFIGYFYRNNIK
ncbi:hypothetical protein IV494_10805 [Kaistella sp. G5-32]|uniref:Uncharacterized protein n=1 Tax=Kaistella gelatinilytica TaxID=2787636 RepID=A0ABS0FD75_9FLAO|nr:hypothetical protein [Kaistella gelatinilytica]MBF8457668.1 hypothetical protein [Kaistella gelatinilytica]